MLTKKLDRRHQQIDNHNTARRLYSVLEFKSTMTFENSINIRSLILIKQNHLTIILSKLYMCDIYYSLPHKVFFLINNLSSGPPNFNISLDMSQPGNIIYSLRLWSIKLNFALNFVNFNMLTIGACQRKQNVYASLKAFKRWRCMSIKENYLKFVIISANHNKMKEIEKN